MRDAALLLFVRLGLQGQALGALQLEARIVAGVERGRRAFEVQGVRRHRIEKVAVVADQ